MTSAAQVAANRANAQKSTGPKTPEGKQIVSQNAIKHGLLSERILVSGEDPGEFEFYRKEMLGQLAPVSGTEILLAERIVGLSWRLQRAEFLQTRAFDVILAGPPAPDSASSNPALRDLLALQL